MKKKINIWLVVAFLFIGYSGGIITGVIVDVDKVYNTTVENIKHKRGAGDIVIDVDQQAETVKSKRELKKEKKSSKKEERKINREIRKAERKDR